MFGSNLVGCVCCCWNLHAVRDEALLWTKLDKTAVKFICVSFIYFFVILVPAPVIVITVSALES